MMMMMMIIIIIIVVVYFQTKINTKITLMKKPRPDSIREMFSTIQFRNVSPFHRLHKNILIFSLDLRSSKHPVLLYGDSRSFSPLFVFYLHIFICSSYKSFSASLFQFLGEGWDWVHLVRRPPSGLLYQPQMIYDECGAVGRMRIGRGNQSTRRKPATVSMS
jgi:hypothetical protein